jgi:hypothetical protein
VIQDNAGHGKDDIEFISTGSFMDYDFMQNVFDGNGIELARFVESI